MIGKRLSRRKLAIFLAEKLATGTSRDTIVTQVAAYLVDTKQTRDVALLVRDIEEQLMHRGVVIADVVVARPLTSDVKSVVASLLETKELHIRETVDPTVLGGVRIDIPGKRYDATMKHKLNLLKATNR